MIIISPYIRVIAAAAAFTAVVSGCMPSEDPIAPYDRGGVERTSVKMGSDYRDQIYFDLESGTSAGSSKITSWDLGFECAADGFHVVLNSSRIMAAADAGAVDFASVTSATGAAWHYDTPDGDLDSTAVGTWWSGEGSAVTSKGHVYLIDRGYDEAGKHQGYRKIEIEGASAGEYTVKFSSLNGTGERVVRVAKDTATSFVGLSLGDGSTISEPRREAWDILFTRYTHIFYNPGLTPYAVTGALLNPWSTSVAVDSVRSFRDITSADVEGYRFTSKRNAIGYEWKVFDLNAGLYTVRAEITYIVKTATGFYYKLHFVDFYENGVKGVPTFEYQKL